MIMVMEHRDNQQEQQRKMIIYLYIQMTRRPKENHGHLGKMGGHLSQKCRVTGVVVIILLATNDHK